MATYNITTELPDPYSSLIGKIIVQWAYQERLLRDLVFALLDIGPKHGRIAVRTPRAEEQIPTIQQLMGLEGINCESVDLKKLGKNLAALRKYRDLFAHGLWGIHPDTGLPGVQDLTGNWKPDPNGPKVSRRIMPQLIVVKEDGFHSLIEAIRQSILATHAAHNEIVEKLETLRSRYPEPKQSNHRTRKKK